MDKKNVSFIKLIIIIHVQLVKGGCDVLGQFCCAGKYPASLNIPSTDVNVYVTVQNPTIHFFQQDYILLILPFLCTCSLLAISVNSIKTMIIILITCKTQVHVYIQDTVNGSKAVDKFGTSFGNFQKFQLHRHNE